MAIETLSTGQRAAVAYPYRVVEVAPNCGFTCQASVIRGPDTAWIQAGIPRDVEDRLLAELGIVPDRRFESAPPADGVWFGPG